MPSSKDTYSAAQAAEVIGVSERRIRQLVAEGKLPGERRSDGTVRIPQQAVNEERKRRRGTRAAPASGNGSGPPRTRRGAAGAADASVDVDALAAAVASAVGQRIEGQLEVTRRAESLVRGELDEERARRLQTEAQLAEAERRIAELETELERHAAELQAVVNRRGLFRRRRAVNGPEAGAPA